MLYQAFENAMAMCLSIGPCGSTPVHGTVSLRGTLLWGGRAVVCDFNMTSAALSSKVYVRQRLS